jgi:membrane-bound serine protease (ClpP class)
VTELRPAGVVAIDGRRIDVVTGGELVPRGTPVTVVKVEGNRIVVRAT